MCLKVLVWCGVINYQTFSSRLIIEYVFLIGRRENQWAVILWLVVVNCKSWGLIELSQLSFSLWGRAITGILIFLSGTSEHRQTVKASGKKHWYLPLQRRLKLRELHSIGNLGGLKQEFLNASWVDSSGCIFVFCSFAILSQKGSEYEVLVGTNLNFLCDCSVLVTWHKLITNLVA